MPKAYSGDLRVRVIEAVEAGASRHEAAECFEVSVASAVKWLQRWNKERSAAPKPRGGSVSPLEVFASKRLNRTTYFLTASGSEKMWRGRAAGGYESKVCLILPSWCLSTRPLSARTW